MAVSHNLGLSRSFVHLLYIIVGLEHLWSQEINIFVLLCFPAILLHRAKAGLTLLDENRNTALHLACSKVRATLIHKIQKLSSSVLSIATRPIRMNQGA